MTLNDLEWTHKTTSYTLCLQKSQRIFSIILFRTLIEFGLILEPTQDTTVVAFPIKLNCVIPLPETFYFNDVLQN